MAAGLAFMLHTLFAAERLSPSAPEHLLLHLASVLMYVVGRFGDDRVVEALREARLEAIHLDADLVDDVERVGVGVLVDQDPAGGLAVDEARRLVILRGELDAGHVLEADDRAVV